MTRTTQGLGPETPYEVIVIGAGQPGQAIAQDLRDQGRRFLVLDAGSEQGATVSELARAGDHFEVRTSQRSYFAHQVVVMTGALASDYSWITIPGVTRDGALLHERGVSPVPGIYALGVVDADAEYVAARIASHVTGRAAFATSNAAK